MTAQALACCVAVEQRSVVLVHGSAGSSNSMHPMARAFAGAGYVVYALDIRGHGGSGRKGQIAYVGQLEDDMVAFVKVVAPKQPSSLVGFSSGSRFVLRVAGGPRQNLVFAFALNEKARAILTPEYSYALTVNFSPHDDYVADIDGVARPCALIAGDADEVFHTDRFEPLLRGAATGR